MKKTIDTEKTLITTALKTAKKLLLEHGGVIPMLFLITDHGDIVTPFPNDIDMGNSDHKRAFIKACGKIIRRKYIILAVYMVSEVWYKKIDTKRGEKMDTNKAVHDYNDKKEALCVNFVSKNLNCTSVIQEYERLNDKIIFKKSVTFIDNNVTIDNNILVNIFQP